MIAATTRRQRKPRAAAAPELGQERILHLDSIRPSPENAELYRPVDPNDPEIIALAGSIRQHGLRVSIDVTQDGWIISGHRRHVAARLAGLTHARCNVFPIRRTENLDRFVKLLREYNRQRVKSLDEQLREEVVSADPEEAYQALIAHRRANSVSILDTIPIRAEKSRARISPAKFAFLGAAAKVIDSRREFWPVSVRQIHYALLNAPPLIHSSKPDSTYNNTPESYRALVDLLIRARLDGSIPWEAIGDETRPVETWRVHRDVQPFLRSEINGLFKGYWRDLQQSQPNHIEIIGEKNTIGSIIRPVASDYCLPVTLGRGFCSSPPRHDMAVRFKKSGKGRLILLILSDFDPDGQEIAHSFARSMRDEFGIDAIDAVQVALTADQVQEFALPPQGKAKRTSTNYKRFAREHGDQVYELEALPPETLQALLRQAIDSVLDVDLFNHELDQEKQDAAFLATARRRAQVALAGIGNGEARQ
ncbi:MAG: ParB/RepB/Spo0J family partition protein [Thermoguttaceae bacterium]|jgi:hypothetical protein